MVSLYKKKRKKERGKEKKKKKRKYQEQCNDTMIKPAGAGLLQSTSTLLARLLLDDAALQKRTRRNKGKEIFFSGFHRHSSSLCLIKYREGLGGRTNLRYDGHVLAAELLLELLNQVVVADELLEAGQLRNGNEDNDSLLALTNIDLLQ